MLTERIDNNNNQYLPGACYLHACFPSITSFNLYNNPKVPVGAHFTGMETEAQKSYKVSESRFETQPHLTSGPKLLPIMLSCLQRLEDKNCGTKLLLTRITIT